MTANVVIPADAARTPVADPRPCVLIIGGQAKLVLKARELGLDVVYAQYPKAFGAEHAAHVDLATLIDFGDIDRLLPVAKALHEVRPFQAAISMFELGLLPAAQINEALGLNGETVETTHILLDKARMRQVLAEKGVSPMATAVGRTAQDIHDFITAHGLPLIVKPIRESGSIGVFLISDASEVEDVVAKYQLLARGAWTVGDLFSTDSFGDFLIEEYLDGPEIGVETLSFDGRHVILAVTDKVELGGATGFVELGLSQPSKCPPEGIEATKAVVRDFLDAVGLRNGASHTELRITSRGPRIIESHNRVGGIGINEMTMASTGIDIERYALGARLGVLEPLTKAPDLIGGAAVIMFDAEPGRVVAIDNLEAVRADPACTYLKLNVAVGDVVKPLNWNDDIVGYVVVRGVDADDAIAHGRRLAKTLIVRTAPLP